MVKISDLEQKKKQTDFKFNSDCHILANCVTFQVTEPLNT